MQQLDHLYANSFKEFLYNINIDTKPTVCVDMDGTLIKEDYTLESFKWILLNKPYLLLKLVIILLIQGISGFKYAVVKEARVDLSKFTYNEKLIMFLKNIKNDYKIVLATAAGEPAAYIMAEHLEIFHEIIASPKNRNYRAQHKAKILNDIYGKCRYVYIGNSYDDLRVWVDSCAIVAVVEDEALRAEIEQLTQDKFYLGDVW